MEVKGPPVFKNKAPNAYVAQEKVRIVLESLISGEDIPSLCRREGILEAEYYTWCKDFLDGGESRLRGEDVIEAYRDEIERIKKENEYLKKLIKDMTSKTGR